MRITRPAAPCVLFVAAFLAFASRTAAQPSNYTVTDLGTLGGGNSAYAYGISASPVDPTFIVGTASVGAEDRAFRYSNGVMTDLGTIPGVLTQNLRAESVANSGIAVGSAEGCAFGGMECDQQYARALLFPLAGSPIDLSTEIGPGFSYAHGINPRANPVDPEWIVGENTYAALTAFRRIDPDGPGPGAATLEFLYANPVDPSFATVARAVNDLGQTVGTADFEGQSLSSKAALWSADDPDNPTRLDPETDTSESSEALAISSPEHEGDAWIVGYIRNDLGGKPPVITVIPASWRNGQMTSLPLPPGETQGIAYAVNTTSDPRYSAAIGETSHLQGMLQVHRACLWPASGGAIPLTATDANWTLRSAHGINNAGQIICSATNPNVAGGDPRAVLLTPAAPSIALNEIRIDQPSYGRGDVADPDEYFELHGPTSASLNGYWYLVIGDGPPELVGGQPRGGSGVVEEAIDLTGQAFDPINPDWLVAEDGVLPTETPEQPDFLHALNFENNDNVTHLLVKDFTGSIGDDLDYDDDGTLDATPWDSVEDCVAILKEPSPQFLGDKVYCSTRVGPFHGTKHDFAPGHVRRTTDGTGDWAIGSWEFNAAGDDTPGASNRPAVGACCDTMLTTCNDAVLQQDCTGPNQVWSGATTCAEDSTCAGLGACCNPALETCTDGVTAEQCTTTGGEWAGAGTLCGTQPHCEATGACCPSAGACSVQTRSACIAAGGWFRGHGVQCVDVDCDCDKLMKLNEVRTGNPLADTEEFIEIYAPACTIGPHSLAGMSLIIVDGDTLGSPLSRNYKRLTFRVDFPPGALNPNLAAAVASGPRAGRGTPGASGVARDLRPAGAPAGTRDATRSANAAYYVVGTMPCTNLVGATADPSRGCTPPVVQTVVGQTENGSQTVALVRTQDIAACEGDPDDPNFAPPPGCNNRVDDHVLTDASVTSISNNKLDAVATTDTDAGDNSYFGAPVVKDGEDQASYMQRTTDGQGNDASAWDTQWGADVDGANDESSPGASNGALTGACCVAGVCQAGVTRYDCETELGGSYRGNLTTCTPDPCVGACCIAGSCTADQSRAACEGAGGAWMGEGSPCGGGICNFKSIAAAEAVPSGSPVVMDQLVVISTDDVIGDPGVKSFQVRRAAEGMTIFGGNSEIDAILAQIALFDTISISGTTDEFLGLFELTGRVAPLRLLSHAALGGGANVQTLTAADLQDGAALAETDESRVVRLDCMTFLDGGTGVFEADRSYRATGGTDLVDVWIPSTATGLVGAIIPTGAKDLRGILWQADHEDLPPDPRDKGYRLTMRNSADMLVSVTCGATLGACCAPAGTCSCGLTTQANCAAASGTYSGDGTTCTPATLCDSNRLKGDIEGEGDVDLADMELFVLALLGSPQQTAHIVRSDLNCDGSVNALDIAGMTAALTP